jgi:hypothetical protein
VIEKLHLVKNESGVFVKKMCLKLKRDKIHKTHKHEYGSNGRQDKYYIIYALGCMSPHSSLPQLSATSTKNACRVRGLYVTIWLRPPILKMDSPKQLTTLLLISNNVYMDGCIYVFNIKSNFIDRSSIEDDIRKNIIQISGVIKC